MPPSEERERYDKTECALRDYTKKIFNTVISRHGKAKSIFLINDPFNQEKSIIYGETKKIMLILSIKIKMFS